MKEYAKHDKYRPVVTIKKLKGKVPTVVEMSGRRYVYEPRKGDKK